VLARGYAVIRDGEDRPLPRAAMLSEGQAFQVEFADGRVQAFAGEGGGSETPPSPPKPAPRKASAKPVKTDPPKQGSLF
jgi:exodeoxyribonuclease VII large subunit